MIILMSISTYGETSNLTYKRIIQNNPTPSQPHKDKTMAQDKYDLSKTLKLSSKNISKLDYLVREKHFKTDSEALRYCIDFVYALSKNNMLIEAGAKLLEDIE